MQSEAPNRQSWTCFHCSETFTTTGSARDHFGATPNAEAGCLIRVKYGDERGLQMELRKAEARINGLDQRLGALMQELDAAKRAYSDLFIASRAVPVDHTKE